MFFYNDRPYQGTRPADLESDESSDSSGFADPLSDGITAFAWVFIVLLIAFITWSHKNGSLPLWG